MALFPDISNKHNTAKPYLKWSGSKHWMRKILYETAKNHFATNYYEPFVGSGAFFFYTQRPNAYLSDSNPLVISLHKAVKCSPEYVYSEYMKLKETTSKGQFEYIKQLLSTIKNEKPNDRVWYATYAAKFLYINRFTAFGSYTENRKGKITIPYFIDHSIMNKNHVLNESLLVQCSKALQDTRIEWKKYHEVDIREDSFYYFDPPYHETGRMYNKKGGFDEYDHTALKEICDKIHAVGSRFMLSNSSTPFTNDLFKEYTIDRYKKTYSNSMKKLQEKEEILVRNF